MSQEVETGMTMYEFNRANMGQFPVCETQEQIEKQQQKIVQYLNTHLDYYYMMLNHERRDFTVFKFPNLKNQNCIKSMVQDIFECMRGRGLGVICAEPDETTLALEIWVKDLETEAVYMYLIFPYGQAIIEYNEKGEDCNG